MISVIELFESQSLRFVVHEHLAKRAGRHFDLRFEKDNTLKSWAIRNLDQLVNQLKSKVLAVQMPDHVLSYIDFQGELKDGYGAGKVNIWDSGTYQIIEWSNDKIVVEFKGNKLNGKYALIKPQKNQKDDQWLILKTKKQ